MKGENFDILWTRKAAEDSGLQKLDKPTLHLPLLQKKKKKKKKKITKETKSSKFSSYMSTARVDHDEKEE